mmetsp:Transcript_19390/g.56279  ORF Transcript_19390/g.56279 Transcript_19390/m.56279 type:complete len:213 (+) Transcript_19390:531-1169(+)
MRLLSKRSSQRNWGGWSTTASSSAWSLWKQLRWSETRASRRPGSCGRSWRQLCSAWSSSGPSPPWRSCGVLWSERVSARSASVTCCASPWAHRSPARSCRSGAWPAGWPSAPGLQLRPSRRQWRRRHRRPGGRALGHPAWALRPRLCPRGSHRRPLRRRSLRHPGGQCPCPRASVQKPSSSNNQSSLNRSTAWRLRQRSGVVFTLCPLPCEA